MPNRLRARPAAKAAEPSTDAPYDPNRLGRVGLTREELMDQPEVIRRTIDLVGKELASLQDKLAERTITRIYIIGCGDSWFAGIGVKYALEKLLNIPFEAVQALDFALYNQTISTETIVIGISSSGTTEIVLRSLRRAREQGAFTIGLSNTNDSALLTEFDARIFVPAQRRGWPTQASTASMVALLLFGLQLNEIWNQGSQAETFSLRESLRLLPGKVKDLISDHDATTQALARKYVRGNYFMFTGAGAYYASALFGAAKIKELCPIHSVAMPLEEFHHYRTCKENDVLFVVAPSDASKHRAKDTVDVGTYDGGRVVVLTDDKKSSIAEFASDVIAIQKIDESLAPILFTIPLQLFAYHLAMEKFDRGIGYTPAFPK